MNVGKWVDKGDNTLLLVIVESPVPCRAKNQRCRDQEEKQMFPRNARHEHHAKPYRSHDDAAAEVGLEEYENEEDECIRSGKQYVSVVRDLHMSAREIFCKYRRKYELCGVCRLQRKKTKVKSVLRAFHERT